MTAARLLAALEAEGVTHVVTLPDNASAPLLARLATHDGIRTVNVTREGEAFAVAAGLWLGGGEAVILIQNTGLLESGDGLRGTVQRMGVPVVAFVTVRGAAKLRASGIDPDARPLSREDLTRADVDSAALLTGPTLEAWSVPFEVCESDDDATRVHAAFARARRERRPVAVLLPHALV